MNAELTKSWFKTNSTKILLILGTILVIVLASLTFWLRIRGFKITDLLLRLQVANAKNEVSHLQTKKAVLIAREDVKTEEISKLEKEIKDEKKKIESGKMKIQGMSDDEILARFNELGF